MRAVSFIRSIKWGAVMAILAVGGANYTAFAHGDMAVTTALGATAIVFAILTERDRA